MEGGKSRKTLTVADVEPELMRVLTENAVDYSAIYLMLDLVFLLGVMYIEFIPIGIKLVLELIGLFVLCVCGITTLLNFTLGDHLRERDTFLKNRRMWKMLAPLLLLQPRAYPLMIQYLSIEEKEDEDSLV